MRVLGYSKGTSLVVLLIRNNVRGKRKLNPAASFSPIQRDIDQLKLLKIRCQIISSP